MNCNIKQINSLDIKYEIFKILNKKKNNVRDM